MVPALAFGLAAVAHRAGRWAAGRAPLRLGFSAILIGAAVAIVVVGYEPAPEAPFPGSESGARFVDAAIGRDDVVIVTNNSVFASAISTTTPVGVTETPDHQVGFAPVYRDPRIKSVGAFAAEPASPEEILAWTAAADRVFVLTNGPLYHGRKVMRSQLVPAGLRLAESRSLLWSVVDIYHQ